LPSGAGCLKGKLCFKKEKIGEREGKRKRKRKKVTVAVDVVSGLGAVL